jgi:hypothetical protein
VKKNRCHAVPERSNPCGEYPYAQSAITAGLKCRLHIDLVIFHVLESLEFVSSIDVSDDLLDQIDLPVLRTLAEVTAEALEQEPEAALITLSDLMEPINCYSGVFEYEEWFDEAARLKESWYHIEKLLAATYPDIGCEPWVDIPAAVRSRQVKAAA